MLHCCLFVLFRGKLAIMTTPLFFSDPHAFRAWLEKHATTATDLAVGYYKLATGRPTMSWSDSVDEALCFGWIDGRRNGIDAHSYMIRFTPRKAGSIWSLVNIAKVEALRAQGRMTAAGEAAYAARSEGKSGIYSHERDTPAALARAELAAFKRNKDAWKYFEAAPPGYRKRMLHWICSAKRDATRTTRLAKLIEASAGGLRLGDW